MAEALKTKEQLEKEWWDRWWAADYSWDQTYTPAQDGPRTGLAAKAWAGWVVDKMDLSIHEADSDLVKAAEGRFAPATLQDYWRDQEGDLIASPDGKLAFTRVHLPQAWRDGTPTGKGEWGNEALDAILAPRLIAGAETTGAFGFRSGEYDWDATGVDRRTQLQGAILLRAASHPEGPTSPVHLQCRGARFLGTTDFTQQVFGPGAGFYGATFSGDARFGSATFSGDAWFESATFSGDAWFRSATFSGEALFRSATFSGDTWFESATFSGDAWFDSATFSGVARFRSATFSGDTWFESATFSGDTRFGFTTFHKDAWFTASGEAEARKPATFIKLADFNSAVFKAPARFREARFSGRMNFDKVLFGAIADFSKIEAPTPESDWRGAFDGVLFERAVDLRGVDPKTVSMIAGATLDRDVLLDRTDEHAEARAHRQALRFACDAEDRDDALKALESGALKLKQAMNTANDVAREQRFYRLELRARRKQKGTKGTEKFFSLLYAGASKYGGSIGWPLLWLGGVIVGFAALYLAIEGQLKAPEPKSVFESLRYSLSRVIPLGTWDESDDPLRVKLAEAPTAAGQGAAENAGVADRGCSFRERLMATDDCRPDLEGAWLEAYRLVLSALATFQTVIAAALYFLLALAVRRKFQIS